MAGVLHQEQLGRYREGLVFRRPVPVAFHGLADAAGMDGQGLAQIESGDRKQLRREGHGKGQSADTRVGLLDRREIGCQALELAAHRLLGGAQQVPDLVAALGVVFTQRTHVAAGQGLHVFLDLVLAQVAAQQGDPPALLLGLECPRRYGDQGHQ